MKPLSKVLGLGAKKKNPPKKNPPSLRTLIWDACLSDIIETTAHLLCASAPPVFSPALSVLLSNMIPTLACHK